ncbi:MAG: hypothetical protein QW649_01440 [Thermoplasmata archaeon]
MFQPITFEPSRGGMGKRLKNDSHILIVPIKRKIPEKGNPA